MLGGVVRLAVRLKEFSLRSVDGKMNRAYFINRFSLMADTYG
jgi:hypothetical protein